MAFNILIVDDSPIVRKVLADTIQLTELDIGEIHQAENGKEGLEQLKNNWIDLVMVDINMPVMNGIEMIKQMQADQILEKTPVVVVSTEGNQQRLQELKDAGVRDTIRKPFTPEQIRDLIIKYLGG